MAIMKSRAIVACVCFGFLAAVPAAGAHTPPAATPLRDGSHDFDFEHGTWQLHIRRLLHPLTGSHTWVEYDGAKTDIPVWGGKANIAEVKADGPAGHLAFAALRLYDPAAHQWSLRFARANSGTFGTPLFGEMRGGHFTFIGPDTLDGRNILVRFVMQSDGPGRASSEQYFSGDGGETWELNWINRYTLTKGPQQ